MDSHVENKIKSGFSETPNREEQKKLFFAHKDMTKTEKKKLKTYSVIYT